MANKHHQHNYINGALSGLLTVFITQPFQVIRTSMMVTYLDGKTSGFIHITKRLFQEEGLKGFYRGLTPTIIKTPIATGVYFSTLERSKSAIDENIKISTNTRNFIASGFARSIQCIIANPILLIITRFEVIGFKSYNSFLHAFIKIKQEEGFLGYFKGLKALLVKEVPTGAIFYVLYESFKFALHNMGINSIQLLSSTSAMTANIILTVLNNPFDVIRTRLQYHHFSKIDHHDYRGIFSGIYYIAKNEGLRGLCVGMIPRMLKRSTGSAIAWTVYETLQVTDSRKSRI
jgi:hypothetical protein